MQRAPRRLLRLLVRFEAQIEEAVRAFALSLPEGSRVLDAGAGECQYAHHFRHCRLVSVDLAIGDAAWDYSRLDAVADLVRLPFADGAFDAVLNLVVLEHTSDPGRVLAELARTLRPGGRLLLALPQEWEIHQVPHDYFRFTRFGAALLLERAGFRSYTIEPAGGFFTLLGRRVLMSALFFQGGWRWLAFPFVAPLAGALGVLLPALDPLDHHRHNTLGYVCRATR